MNGHLTFFSLKVKLALTKIEVEIEKKNVYLYTSMIKLAKSLNSDVDLEWHLSFSLVLTCVLFWDAMGGCQAMSRCRHEGATDIS